MRIKSTGNDRKPWMTDEYVAYLRSDTWARIRAKALERAEHRCEQYLGRNAWCEATDGLQVHHKRYPTFGFELPDDLIVLCETHHRHADLDRRNSARLATLRRKYGDWRPTR
jgi:hypothetical protein